MATGADNLVAQCAPSDFDGVTGQCTQVQWVPQQSVSFFPPLTAAEGLAVSGAIGACWAIGFLVRILRRTVGVS